eukprot:6199867-Pleurochrysis_carterae.AAC.8
MARYFPPNSNVEIRLAPKACFDDLKGRVRLAPIFKRDPSNLSPVKKENTQRMQEKGQFAERQRKQGDARLLPPLSGRQSLIVQSDDAETKALTGRERRTKSGKLKERRIDQEFESTKDWGGMGEKDPERRRQREDEEEKNADCG